MIKLNNYNEKEALSKFYSFLNDKIEVKAKDSKFTMGKKGKLLFSNDPIFKFISQVHLASIKDYEQSKKISANRILLPTLNESYLNFHSQNYLKSSDLNNDYTFDPFYLVWVKQIELYFKDLEELTTEYFDGTINDNSNRNQFRPVDFFMYFNRKIIKLKRRAQLINILLELNPSIVKQEIKDSNKIVKKIYTTVRCNWIDDCGDIDRNILMKVDDELGNVETGDKNSRDFTNITAVNFKPELYSRELFEIILSLGFSGSFEYENRNNPIYKIRIDDKKYDLDFSGTHLTLAKVLSLLEFDLIYKKFTEIYKNT